MITYYRNTPKGLTTLPSFERNCWINVVNPTPEELNRLVEEYRLDRDLLVEGLDENELPRLDVDERTTYIFVKALASENNRLITFLIILQPHFLLTFSKEEASCIKSITQGKIRFSWAETLLA